MMVNNPNGNRTRISGATVRRTCRYTMGLYLLLRLPQFAMLTGSQMLRMAHCFAQKNRLPLRTSGGISNDYWFLFRSFQNTHERIWIRVST